MAERVGSVRRVVFAAPDYLDRRGVPQHPSDLAHHRLVVAQGITPSLQWYFLDNGAPLSVPVNPRMRMNTNDAIIEIVSRGWGISRTLSYQVAGGVADGTLQTILTTYEPPPLPIHVIHQEGRLVSSKVRALVDYMVDRLRADQRINQG